MKRMLIAVVAVLLLVGAGSQTAVAQQADSANTFAGTQYYNIVSGNDKGHNTASVLAGLCVAGRGSSTRWYVGAEMADQQEPQSQGGVGPSLIVVADVECFKYNGKPVSIIGSMSYIDHARYDPESESFAWGPWTGLGLVFHASDEAKITLGAKGSPSTTGYIENIGFGPGLFIMEPELQIAKIVKGAAKLVDGILGGLLN